MGTKLAAVSAEATVCFGRHASCDPSLDTYYLIFVFLRVFKHCSKQYDKARGTFLPSRVWNNLKPK